MKWLINVTFTLLFSFTLMFSANAMDGSNKTVQPNMPHPPWDDWSDSGHGHHGGNFKIADLLDDEGPEIVFLKGETLIIMDNQGTVLIEKEVEDIEDSHEGWWFMPGHNHNGGEIGLEVADLDDDETLEIIIMDAEKLIVLDNDGDPKPPNIPLPEVGD